MAILLRCGALKARGAGGRPQAAQRPDPKLAAAHWRVGRDARPRPVERQARAPARQDAHGLGGHVRALVLLGAALRREKPRGRLAQGAGVRHRQAQGRQDVHQRRRGTHADPSAQVHPQGDGRVLLDLRRDRGHEAAGPGVLRQRVERQELDQGRTARQPHDGEGGDMEALAVPEGQAHVPMQGEVEAGAPHRRQAEGGGRAQGLRPLRGRHHRQLQRRHHRRGG